jgi:hypothetical protein
LRVEDGGFRIEGVGFQDLVDCTVHGDLGGEDKEFAQQTFVIRRQRSYHPHELLHLHSVTFGYIRFRVEVWGVGCRVYC